MKINGFICAAQNDAAVTKPWPQFPDSLSSIGIGGWESLASETRYCPTPDCPVVYTVSHDIGKCFFCAHCGTSTCKESIKEVDEWMEKNKKSRKRYPQCNIPIEKNKGCNHVHCCHVVFSWYLLGVPQVTLPDTPNDCYNHLHDQHKGSGLWD